MTMREWICGGILVGSLVGASPAMAFTLGAANSSQLGWSTRTVTFNYNFTDCGVDVSRMKTALSMAIKLYNSVPTSFVTLKMGAAVTTTIPQGDSKIIAKTAGSPEIICSNTFGADLGLDDNVVAGSTSFFTNSTSHIAYAYVGLNGDSGAHASMQNIDTEVGIQGIAVAMAHEMGHSLGLGHSPDPQALMYFDTSAKTELRLSQDDIDGITYLYPRDEFGGSGVFGCGTIRLDGGGGSGGPGGFAAWWTMMILAWGLTRIRARRMA
ncbi:MAG TPA: matrixin family metalloprotease [Bdellovibrionota bacterium]|nr:matrixin family metalloprotease [Bdellovibrionota bacterium]